MKNETNQQFTLPKNIRQIGTFGDTYKIYVEDFVYTYVHQFVHRRKKEGAVVAAVLLGQTYTKENQEYVFISGAQRVDFLAAEEADASNRQNAEESGAATQPSTNPVTDVLTNRQQEFWNRVYQGIKEYFDEQEILGWYFNVDGGNLQIDAELQQFFESTYKKGSRFLYLEDAIEKEDAFFVQEQHKLQRISGYAVYYEKNPAMQEFMIAEKEKNTPRPLREKYVAESNTDDVAQNYRAIMNKLNEKPPKRKGRPALYVAGVAVLAVVVATGITQIGNYQNLKLLEQTMQTLSGAVNRNHDDSTDAQAQTAEVKEELSDQQEEPADTQVDGTSSDPQPAEADTTAQTDASGEDNTDYSDVSGVSESVTDSDGQETLSASGTQEVSDAQPDETVSQAETVESSQPTEPAVDNSAPASAALPDYYVVKKGDSLVSISKSLYNTTDMIDDICDLNHIENVDIIYEGQKLLLPK